MYYDSESGLYNNGARTFSPITGRYLQTDLLDILDSGTTNTFAYANSNPFRFVDFSGAAAHVLLLDVFNPQNLIDWAKSYQPTDYNTVVLHGVPSELIQSDATRGGALEFSANQGPGPRYTPLEIAAKLTEPGSGFDPNLPILLIACGSASTSAAQDLANQFSSTKQTIWASPMAITFPPDMSGSPILGAPPVTSASHSPVPWLPFKSVR
jgi:RHS repeat-associated protein